MVSRRSRQLIIAALTLVLYGYLLLTYVLDGQLSRWTLPTVLAGLYLADAASGVAHFIVDYTPNAQGIGLKELFDYTGNKGSADYVRRRDEAMKRINGFQEVVFDFKIHHRTPDALGRRSILKMTLPVIVYATFPLTVLLIIVGHLGILSPNLSLFVAILVGAGTISQYSHACTHKHPPPAAARVAQRLGLFLPPKAHEIHHADPGRHFCLLNGWANPLINRVFKWVLARGYLKPEGLRVT